MAPPSDPADGRCHDEDLELARRCGRGDEDAQRVFVDRFGSLVYAICGRSGIEGSDREDVAQQILSDAFRALPCHQGTSRLSTWIYSLALRRVADHFRSPQPSRTSGAAQGVDGLLNCEAFLDRLYDDDARAAGRGRGAIPPDLASHMLACERCRAEYRAAHADDLLLRRALLDVPSPAWRAEALRQMARSPRASWSQRIATVNRCVIWGVLAVAASQLLLGGHSTAAYLAAFWAGGAAALLRPSLEKHWRLIRRPLRWV